MSLVSPRRIEHWRGRKDSVVSRACAVGLGLLLLVSIPAQAQPLSGWGTRTGAIDTVIGTQNFFVEDRGTETQVVVDTFASAELAPGVQVSLRPVLWRVRGEWETLVEHMSIRYEFTQGSNWRIEAGRFPSPIGFGMTENRPNVNPGVIWCHRPYYMPLPSLGGDVPRLSLVGAVYPTGVQVGTSGVHWDARAAVVDRAPIDFWKAEPDSARHANMILGGGLTPRQGLRIGASTAWGTVAGAGPSVNDLTYRMINIEGEYAFGYTRLSGELTRDTIDVPAEDRTVTGWTVQAQQTLTPRVFAHSRMSNVRSPAALGNGTFSNRTYRAIDSTVGYLVSPELTVRLSHAAIESFNENDFDHQIGLSFMWARRWW